MDLLTAIASSTQPSTAATAKDAATPNDQFNALLTTSMNGAKAALPVATSSKEASSETPAASASSELPATDMSGQSILAMLTQINAYQAATSGKDSPATTATSTGQSLAQPLSDSRRTSPAVAMATAAATSASLATTDLAKPAPTPSTEPSNSALALDKLTTQLKKTEPADAADTSTAASLASTPSQTLTSTHLATALKPVMDAPQTTVPQALVNTPFGKSGWTQAVAQQVMVMVKDKVQTISLALNPPNLGPLQVVVKIENQVANVQFSSAVPEVQQALREGLPVLQDMLGQAGVALGQADIGNRQPQRGQKNNPDKLNEASASPEEEFSQSIHVANQTDTSQRRGLVNIYA